MPSRFKLFRFSKNSLAARLFISTTLISMASILILSGIFYFFFSRTIQNNMQEIMETVVENKSRELETLFETALKNGYRIADDPVFQNVLKNPRPDSVSEVYSLELDFDNKLAFIQNYVNDIFGFYVIGLNGLQFKSNFSSPVYKDWEFFYWFRNIKASPDPVWFEPHTDSFVVDTIGQSFVTLGMRIIDKTTGSLLGILLVDFEVSTLQKKINNAIGESGELVLTDSNRHFICASDEKMTGDHTESAVFDYAKISRTTGWQLQGKIHDKKVRGNVVNILYPVFFLILLIILTDFLVSLSLVTKITNPLSDLSDLMKKVETGDFKVNMEGSNVDEVTQLGDRFNRMVTKIDKLMADLYEEQQKLRIAELKTLEAQINPHFLYNTLDSLIWLARARDNENIILMVHSLTNLFRIGLSKGREVISVEDEVNHVESYLKIQKIRYRDEFDYELNIPEEIKQNRILKLILQPIVENAIYHGIKNSDEMGLIKINADFSDKIIVFHITDTGTGMTDEELRHLKETLRETSTEIAGIGVHNVNERIRLYFGAEYGLEISSREEEGTTVSIMLPRI